MSVWEIFLIGVGLSMDAFAVSIVKGLAMKRIDRRLLFLIAAVFGGFQALMPVAGWLLGSAFAGRIAAYDHWIAFGLLVFIGGKMIWDTLHEDDAEKIAEGRSGTTQMEGTIVTPVELLLLAIATSIDALAVGVTFSFLAVDILPAAGLIGATTFGISAAGVVAGHLTGTRFRDKAQIAGGMVLILLGVRILVEHLL